MGAFKETYVNEFNDATIAPFSVWNPTGVSIVETDRLTLTIPPLTSAYWDWVILNEGYANYWDGTSAGAPNAYCWDIVFVDLPILINGARAGLSIGEPNNNRSLFVGYDYDIDQLHTRIFRRGIADEHVGAISSFPTEDTPHVFRVYYNLTGGNITLPDNSYSLADSRIACFFSEDAGSNFTLLLETDPYIATGYNYFGVSVENYGAWAPWGAPSAGTCQISAECTLIRKLQWDALASTGDDETSKIITYTTNEANPPILTANSPSEGASEVSADTTITGTVTDESTIDASTLMIYINGSTIYNGTSWSSGWTNSTLINNGTSLDFQIVADNSLNYNTSYVISGTVDDVFGNTGTFSFTFSTETPLVASHTVYVSNIDIVNTPSLINRQNQFDEHAALVSLDRLRGEKNSDFRRRIYDTFVHNANSSYQGLVYAITRELGLNTFKALHINPKKTNDSFVTPDPYILFDGISLKLYSDYQNDVLDWSIDRFYPGGNFEHLTNLVNFVNTTENFEASIYLDTDPFTRSMTILNQSNRNVIDMEFIPLSTKFKLKHWPVVNNSIYFSDRVNFKEKVNSEALVVSKGKFYINNETGVVTVYNIPTQNTYARYQYIQYPFVAIASPVIIHDINNENFKTRMFKQILQDNGTFENGIPTELGADIINELLSVVPMYWGI